MKKQTPTPHQLRQQSIHGFIFILIGFIALIMAFSSCSPYRNGCKEVRGKNYKVGYFMTNRPYRY